MLSMLDAKAPVACAVFFGGALEDAEDLIVGSITYGVNDDLQPSPIRLLHALPHRALGKHFLARQATRLRRIIVGIEEEGRCGTEAAVGKSFQAANPKPIISKSGADTGRA